MTASESETITLSPRVANMLKRRGLKPDEVTVSPKGEETSWTFKIRFDETDRLAIVYVKKSSIIIKPEMALPVRWEAMQKVVEAAKEYMEAHKAWHGEENRFNKMVWLKDALAALEGGGD